MLSFWEKQHLLHADIIIAGSGITGLSAACSIKETSPDKQVIILERGILPTGASTKNAGFACIGSVTEKLYDLKLMSEENLLQLISDRWEGLRMLRQRLGDEAIDYQNHGGFELLMEENKVHPDQLDYLNKLFKPVFKKEVFTFQPEKIKAFGFRNVKQMIMNDAEGQINTGLMMNRLQQYAASLGVKIITGAEIEKYIELSDKVEVYLKNQSLTFTASQFILCTNAFTKDLLPEEEIAPGRGQVLITSPIPGLKFKGVFHFDEGFYYFRNVGDRVLFGGGRNLDFEGETTTAFELNPTIQQKLEDYLREFIIPDQPFEVTDRWTGIMAFSKNKLPLVKRISDKVIVGARLNGMGIALGSKIGEQLRWMVLNK